MRKSKGITICGWLYLVSGIIGALSNLHMFSSGIRKATEFELISYVISFLLSCLAVFIGAYVLERKEIWRKIALYESSFMILYNQSTALFIFFSDGSPLVFLGAIPIFNVFILFFFNTKKVKQEFQSETVNNNAGK